MDCGPTCLQMIARHYGYRYSIYHLREITGMSREGVTLSGLENAAISLGFQTWVLSLSIEHLANIPLPAILHWNDNHYVVLDKIDENFHLLDPATGPVKLDKTLFADYWLSHAASGQQGIAIVLTPSAEGLNEAEAPEAAPSFLSHCVRYLARRKRFVTGVVALSLICALFQLFQPWLWTLFYDTGIESKNKLLLCVIVLGQVAIGLLVLFFEYRQSTFILQVSNSISRFLTRNFFNKLLSIPLYLFERRPLGDLLQRISDIDRVEELLSAQTLIALISALSSVLFLGFLFYYQWTYAALFILFTLLSFLWFYAFYPARKIIDYQLFTEHARYQEEVMDILSGIAEIKSYAYGKEKLHRWNSRYARVYQLKRKLTVLGLKQRRGYRAFHLMKDALILFLAGSSVINGETSVGVLLSVSYILQQINTPLEELLLLLDGLQDSVMSVERLKDVMGEPEISDISGSVPLGDIVIKDVSFGYPGSALSLENLTLRLPSGGVTAIVGESGCGKSTLLKLMFGFYRVQHGAIFLGAEDVTEKLSALMPACSAFVQQDGYLFSATLRDNIVLASEWDEVWFAEVLQLCHLTDWVQSLPGREALPIGRGGTPVSGGQKQRILLARALYRRPHFLFLDEASSALDARTESLISQNLAAYSHRFGCTTVVTAHRLSTIKAADTIVVLENRSVAEQGEHEELLRRNGCYAALLQPQTER